MKRGVRFQIPNEYGKYLAEILEPIDCTKYNWKIECSTEIWKVTDGKLGDGLLSDDLIDGNEFSKLIRSSMYYLIFATLKAFPKGVPIIEIPKYEDYISSDCDISFIVADCSYVCLLCKNVFLVEKLYNNAKDKGFEKIRYIDENDNIEGMYNN
jgi:hypothetical protein